MNVGGCVVCHGNHQVQKPSTKMLAGPESVCSQCHERRFARRLAATEMGGLIRKLSAALERSDAILNQAARSGMEVSEATLRQGDARETLVKASVAVHAFQTDAVAKPVDEGLAIARQTHQAGEAA